MIIKREQYWLYFYQTKQIFGQKTIQDTEKITVLYNDKKINPSR